MTTPGDNRDSAGPIPQGPRAEALLRLAREIGHEFKDLSLLALAFVHSSLGNRGFHSNERLEFLGDAVLQLLVSDSLFRTVPEADEGQLTDRRKRIVSRQPLALVCRQLGLTNLLEHERGLTKAELESRRLQANLCEAVLGAVWLDGGLRAARKFVHEQILSRTGDGRPAEYKKFCDPKSALLRWCQAKGLEQPTYELVDRSGPEHAPEFEVQVLAQGERYERGRGSSKQAAEMVAAEKTLEILKKQDEGEAVS